MTVDNNQQEPASGAMGVPVNVQSEPVIAPTPQETPQVAAHGESVQSATQPEAKPEQVAQPAAVETGLAEQAKPQMTASGRSIIRPSAASQSAIAEHSPEMSRPQVPVTPQPSLAEYNEVNGQNANSRWMSVLTKKMFITAILISGGATFALWALGTTLHIHDLVAFISGVGWLILPPLLFVGVMALLVYLEREKERKVALGLLEPKQEKTSYQERRESDEDYRSRMQEVRQYSERGKQDVERGKQDAARSGQPPVQPAQHKVEPQVQESEKVPVAPQPAAQEAEDQLPQPPPEIVFTTQSANALPISRDGGAFFPQSNTKIQSPSPKEED